MPAPSNQQMSLPNMKQPKKTKRQRCPYRKILEFWNTATEGSPLVSVQVEAFLKNESRKGRLKLLWAEFSTIGDPWETLSQLIKYMRGDAWHCGDNNSGWRASLDPYLTRRDGHWQTLLERAHQGGGRRYDFV